MEFDQESFSTLKPVCVKVMNAPIKENVLELKKLIPKVFTKKSMGAEVLHSYVMFPLELHLKSGKIRSEVKIYFVDCMREMIHHIHFQEVEKLLNLYTLLFIQIFDKEREGLVADVSEEMKCSVLNCVSEILKQASSVVQLELYDRKHFRKLCQGIFMCVHMAHAERSRSVRLAAIQCIMAMAQVHDDAESQSPDALKKVGDALMFVLPGIVQGLMKAWTGDEKQGHKITMMSLRAWGKIIMLVMNDSESEDVDQEVKFCFSLNHPIKSSKSEAADPLKKNLLLQDPTTVSDDIIGQARTPEWLKAAAEKLAPHVANLTKLQGYPHRLVRKELASTCRLLLLNCSRNLQPCVIQLLEILIMLSEDEEQDIAEKSKQSIEMFSIKCDNENNMLLEIMEENFFSLITKLPRILRTVNDDGQIGALRLLAGYLRFLGISKLPRVLSVASHLHRLLMTLIHVVELDVSGVSVLDEYSLRDLDACDSSGLEPWKTFRHFTDKDILRKTEEICSLLVRYGDVTVLSDYLLDVFYNAPLHQKEIVFLLNQILSNCTKNVPENSHVIKNVLDVYLEPSVWYVSISTENVEELTNAERHSNLVLACLLVEGVGKIAAALGKSFDQFLLKTLYLVLERAGSSHGLLAQAGLASTYQLARAGGYDNVTQFVCSNVDYFSYHVTMKLRRVEQNPGVLDVLNVVMKHSNLDVLPCMREIVNDVLLQSCDTFQDSSSLAFLRVFHTFINCIHRWCGSEQCTDSTVGATTPISSKKHGTLDDVRKDLLEHLQAKRRLQKFLDGDNEEENPEDQCNPNTNMSSSEHTSSEINKIDEFQEVSKKKVPGHIKMTVAILTRSLNFLPSRNKQQQLLVLEMLIDGIQVLRNWEDELLPVVHLIWLPLVGRFGNASEPLILNRSFQLLCTLAGTAKDFIQSRTLKQVMPSLLKFLKNAAHDSEKKDTGSAYRFTQKYKLQHELLDGLGQLCVDLGLQGRQLDEVLFTVIPYLSTLQPVPLQTCCLKLFETIASANADAVWLIIKSIIEPQAVLSRSEQYLVSSHNHNNISKIKDNADKILLFLEDNTL